MPGLIKGTDKLPKFTIEVGFHRHPKWIGATSAAIGVFVTSLSYCAEHGTDGRLIRTNTPPESLAMALGVPIRDSKKARTELLERGMWEEHDGWLRVHDYLDHNPSAAEVRDNARRRETASIKANHQRHHVGPDGTPNPEICPLCQRSATTSGTDSPSDSDSDSESDTPSDSESGPKLTPRGEERRGEERTTDQVPPLPPPGGGGAIAASGKPKINPRAAGTNPRALAQRDNQRDKQLASARSRGRALATLDLAEAMDVIDREYADRDPELIEAAVGAYNAAREHADA